MQEDEDAGIFREIRARDTNTKALEAMPLPTGTNTNANCSTNGKSNTNTNTNANISCPQISSAPPLDGSPSSPQPPSTRYCRHK